MSANRKSKMGLYSNLSVLSERPMSRPQTRETSHSDTTIGGKSFTTATIDTYKDSSAFYDWPDLPPIENIKAGIVRSRVSKGISYLLPVEKSKSSIETNFQTDLRAMFTEPYTKEKNSYDEARTVASARHHLAPNTAMSGDRKAISRIMSPAFERDMQLNADSEKARRSYSRSAPARTRTRADKTSQQRSNLFIPLKAKIPPELLKLKDEAEKILQSVQEKDDDDDDESKEEEPKEETKPDKRKSTTAFSFFSDPFSQTMSFMSYDNPEGSQNGHGGKHKFVRSTERAGITSFRDFEDIKGPVKPPFPAELRSPYLNETKNDQIWDWLVEGEKIDEFDYFLSVCG